jgi:hypothetical protein
MRRGGEDFIRQMTHYGGMRRFRIDICFQKAQFATKTQKPMRRAPVFKEELSSTERHDMWRFGAVSYWADRKNQRQYADDLFQELHFTKIEDWYGIKSEDMKQRGGSAFLQRHGDSCMRALQFVYPEFNWKLWKFGAVPRGFWDDDNNLHSYVNWLADELNIMDLEDWQFVSREKLATFRGSFVVHKFGGLIALLSKLNPSYNWKPRSALHTIPSKKGQRILFKNIESLFPLATIHLDYKHPELSFKSGVQMELDIFLPTQNIAFEYQGEQHYERHWLYGEPTEQQQKDKEKLEQCNAIGITVVEVPYWWDSQSVESLVATIRQKRPGWHYCSMQLIHLRFVARVRKSKSSANSYHEPKVNLIESCSKIRPSLFTTISLHKYKLLHQIQKVFTK